MMDLTEFDSNRKWNTWKWSKKSNSCRTCWFHFMIILWRGLLLFPESFSKKSPFLTFIDYHLNTLKRDVMKRWFSESTFHLSIMCLYSSKIVAFSWFFTNITPMPHSGIPTLRIPTYIKSQKVSSLSIYAPWQCQRKQDKYTMDPG